MFDYAVLLDYNSTDDSRETLKDIPPSWHVVSSVNSKFDAIRVDDEVQFWEQKFPQAWKICLTTTEFLVLPNLREMLSSLDRSIEVIRFPAFAMVGNDSHPLQRFVSLLKQRSQYAGHDLLTDLLTGDHEASRFMHRLNSVKYLPGRHGIGPEFSWQWSKLGFIAKYRWTPWPEILSRKAQIRSRIPESDLAKGWGAQHNTDREGLTKVRSDLLAHSKIGDLCNIFLSRNMSSLKTMAYRAWNEVTDGETNFVP